MNCLIVLSPLKLINGHITKIREQETLVRLLNSILLRACGTTHGFYIPSCASAINDTGPSFYSFGMCIHRKIIPTASVTCRRWWRGRCLNSFESVAVIRTNFEYAAWPKAQFTGNPLLEQTSSHEVSHL